MHQLEPNSHDASQGAFPCRRGRASLRTGFLECTLPADFNTDWDADTSKGRLEASVLQTGCYDILQLLEPLGQNSDRCHHIEAEMTDGH